MHGKGKGKRGKVRGCTKGVFLFSRPRWVDASTGELGPSSLASRCSFTDSNGSAWFPLAVCAEIWAVKKQERKKIPMMPFTHAKSSTSKPKMPTSPRQTVEPSNCRKSLLLLPAKEAAPEAPLLDLGLVRLQGIQRLNVVATLPASGYIVGTQSPLWNFPELGAISSKRGD